MANSMRPASAATYPSANHALPGPAPARTYFASSRTGDGEASLDPAINLAARIEDAAAAMRTLASERKDAERRLDAALRIAAQPWRKQWMVAGATPAQRIGGTPGVPEIVWSAWMSCLAAAAMSLNLGWLRGKRAISTSSQARNTLGLPLLGEIHLPSGIPSFAQPSPPILKRFVLKAAEWFLIVTLFTLILAALSSQALGNDLFHDPLGALVEAIDSIRAVLR